MNEPNSASELIARGNALRAELASAMSETDAASATLVNKLASLQVLQDAFTIVRDALNAVDPDAAVELSGSDDINWGCMAPLGHVHTHSSAAFKLTRLGDMAMIWPAFQ